MYARLLMFTAKPGTRLSIERLADQLYDTMRDQKDFKWATFMGDDLVGEYGILSLWESKEAAVAAGDGLASARQTLTELAAGPPAARLFEIYEPKA